MTILRACALLVFFAACGPKPAPVYATTPDPPAASSDGTSGYDGSSSSGDTDCTAYDDDGNCTSWDDGSASNPCADDGSTSNPCGDDGSSYDSSSDDDDGSSD